MSHELFISAKVEGPEFFYEQTNKWKYMNDQRAVSWFRTALADLGAVAAKAASKGVGSLTATLTQQWDDEDPQVMVYDNFSYADVTKVHRAFLQKYTEIVDIAEKRNK